MLAENAYEIIAAAIESGISAIRIETDLLNVDSILAARELAGAVDILAVHLPACSEEAYEKVMGVNAYKKVLTNIERFHGEQDVGDHGTPLLIPLFTPTPHNAGEEKPWFERWPYGVSARPLDGPGGDEADRAGRRPHRLQRPGRRSTLGVVGQTPIAQAWLNHPLQAA